MNHIHSALVNIAPERKQEFEAEHSEFELWYVDEAAWTCHVDPSTKCITLSRRVVELLWCVSYAWVVFYERLVEGKKFLKTKMTVDLNSDPKVATAMKLLTWAYANWLNNEDVEWPRGLPSPVPNPETKTYELVADELCLCATAALLHHELAHIRLGHTVTSNIQDEKEADYEMARWILDHNLDSSDARYKKRVLGIAVALELLLTYGIHTTQYGGVTHPRSYDRLISTLSQWVDDENHIAWAFVVAVTKLHLDAAAVTVSDKQYSSFRVCADEYANTLANLKSKS